MSNLSRLTLFAIISSMEEDLREAIKTQLAPQKPLEDILGSDLHSKCHDRFNSDIDLTRDEDSNQLIDYLDFGDSFQILNRNKQLLPSSISTHLLSITSDLQTLVPIRNRVMHTRPLMFDDLAVVSQSAEKLVTSESSFWQNLKTTLDKLRLDPSYVLGLVIPPTEYSRRSKNHNLPLPDFDETGFLGRTKQSDDLVNALLGPFPVVTIVGEGGIGKTALAVKVAYEMVDMEPNPFEYVVWTSSKTSQITIQEITRIEGAIQDSVGLIQSVADELGASGDSFDEILEYLKEFRILLILDNLETVLDDRVRSFLQKLPMGSKVLITSRIGLGSLEFPIRLREMSSPESVQLLRALAKTRNVEQLVKTGNDKLANYCNRMKNNPGYIKWFVSTVQAGKRPEEVLANPDIFLEFCMSNVYQYLSEDSRNILKVMQIVPNELSQAELVFLSEMDDTVLQKSLQELLTTNMVNMTSIPSGSSFQSTYRVSDLARPYLSKKHPVETERSSRITKRRNQLSSNTQEVERDNKENPYSFESINISSKSDLIVAKYLKDAISEAKKLNFDAAERFIKTAKTLCPEFYEVHRVEAYIYDKIENFDHAKLCYEAAIELEPNSAPLRKWYGQFLFIRFQDFDESLQQLNIADKLDPNNFNIELEVARIKTIVRSFQEAETILQKLANRQNLTAWEKRKLVDLKLRFHKEKAEDYLSKRDSMNCLDEMKGFVKTFIDCPRHLHDKLMRVKLYRALPTAYELKDSLTYQTLNTDDADKIIEFLNKNGKNTNKKSFEDKETGYIDKLIYNAGFIQNENGRLYFHFNDLINTTPDHLEIGQPVIFEVGSNSLGTCARKVSLIEPK